MKISVADFLLLTISVFLGTLAAVAVAGWYAQKQASAALAEARASSPLAKLGFW